MLLETAAARPRKAPMIASAAPVALDLTLHDLYGLDGPVPTLVFDASRAPGLGPKFVYPIRFGAAAEDPSWELSPKTLPQRYAFSAGRMPVVVVGLCDADHDNLDRAFSQLRPDQRPVLVTFARPDQFRPPADCRVAVTKPVDCLAHLSHAVDPDVHYEMLSKRGLALSGLCTPPSTVIDTLLASEHVHDGARVDAEVARVVAALDARSLPFVVKLNQSHGSRGVMTVLCEADRLRARDVVGAQLRGMLPLVNAANRGLHPFSVVLQDYLVGPAVGLSLFVTQNGRAVFIVCSDQRFEDNGLWAGGSVCYADQEALCRKYAQPMNDAARFLHSKGYYGPAGIDIMTDDSGVQYIIDINARITGPYHLGLLAGHFVQRGLVVATALKKDFFCSRADFEDYFVREIQQGRLIINAWARNEALSLSQGAVTVGARDAVDMESLLAKVEAYAISPEMLGGDKHGANAVMCSNAHQANKEAYAAVCNILVDSTGPRPVGTMQASTA